MSDTTATDLPRPLSIAREMLQRLESTGQAAPGTADEVMKSVRAGHPLHTSEAVGALFRALDDPLRSARYKGTAEPPARLIDRVLGSLPLRQRAREKLSTEFALMGNEAGDPDSHVESRRRDAEREGRPFTADDERKARADHRHEAAAALAESIVEALDERDRRDCWVPEHAPPLPLGERRIAAALEHFRDDLDPTVDITDLARRWGREVAGPLGPDQARDLVRRRLRTNPHLCRDGEPPANDPWAPKRPADSAHAAGVNRAVEQLRASGRYTPL